jgi:hypothetical protein
MNDYFKNLFRTKQFHKTLLSLPALKLRQAVLSTPKQGFPLDNNPQQTTFHF